MLATHLAGRVGLQFCFHAMRQSLRHGLSAWWEWIHRQRCEPDKGLCGRSRSARIARLRRLVGRFGRHGAAPGFGTRRAVRAAHGVHVTACNIANDILCGLVMFVAVQAFARDEVSRSFDKTVVLAAGQSVPGSNTRMGNVNLRTHGGRDVVVHASIRVSASNDAQAKRVADGIQIEVTPAGSTLNIRTNYPREEHDGFFGFHNLSYSVNLDITMPENAPLELHNNFGAVDVEDLKANGDITNAHGKLTFRTGRGSQRLEDQFAAVEVTGNSGDVDIRNSNGNVDVSSVTGIVNVKDRFGNVTLNNPGHGGTIVKRPGSCIRGA